MTTEPERPALNIFDAVAEIDDSILQQDLDGERVLLNITTGKYFGLDAIGSRIWALLQEHEGDCNKVIDSMLEQFPDTTRMQVGSDLATFLNQLQGAQLVRVSEAVR